MGGPRSHSCGTDPRVPVPQLGKRGWERWAAAVLPAGMCQATAASPAGPRALPAALCLLRYEDEMQCLEKSSPKLTKSSWRRCFPCARHGSSAYSIGTHGKAAPKTIPALPAPPLPPIKVQEKKNSPWAGRHKHSPGFAKCIRSIPATNRLAGALSGTREGRAM